MSAPFLSVDGQGIAATFSTRPTTVSAVVPEPSVTYELNEIKRKLERREAELKRKEKEALGYQKELTKAQKDISISNAEVQSLRERNEQLQQSLLTARAATQAQESRASEQQLLNLDSELAMTKRKLKQAEDEHAHVLRQHTAAKEELQEVFKRLESVQTENVGINTQIKTTTSQLQSTQLTLADRERELESAKRSNTIMKSQNVSLSEQVEQKLETIAEREATIVDLRDTIRNLESSVLVNSEANAILRSQIDEIHDNMYALSKEEYDSYKTLQRDFNALKEQSSELEDNSEYHVNLLQKTEAERSMLRTQLEAVVSTMSAQALEIQQLRSAAATDSSQMTSTKRELARQQKECDELKSQLHELKDIPISKDREVAMFRQAMAAMAKDKQECLESKAEEKRLRKLAEDRSRALSARVSFLLDQLDQLSVLNNSWQDQKRILQTQIISLQEVNFDLRRKLSDAQQSFALTLEDSMAMRAGAVGSGNPLLMTTQQQQSGTMNNGDAADKNINSSNSGGGFFITELDSPFRGLGNDNNNNNGYDGHLTGTMAGNIVDGTAVLPADERGLIERAMFDTVLAFSAGRDKDSRKQTTILQQQHKDGGGGGGGTAGGNKSTKKKGGGGRKQHSSSKGGGVYKAHTAEVGMYDIVFDDGGDGGVRGQHDVDGNELLTALQIPTFMRFCQSRAESKMTALLTEKIASVLTVYRNSMAESNLQLRNARMELATAVSKIVGDKLRIKNAKMKYTAERLAKQLTVMKVVREQMRHSDVCVVVDDISRRANEHMRLLNMSSSSTNMSIELSSSSTSHQKNILPSNTPNGTARSNGTHLTTPVTPQATTAATATATAAATIDRMKTMLSHFISVSDELRTATAPSTAGKTSSGGGSGSGAKGSSSSSGGSTGADIDVPVGAMELRLQDSELDDDTLNGILGLLYSGTANGSGMGNNNGNGDDGAAADETINAKSASANLARSTIRGCDYVSRILLLNLKGNRLTDLSCKLLSQLIENSTELRMLDLRNNAISSEGAKILFAAARRNPSVLYVTERQGGVMVEGHREIVASSNVDGASQVFNDRVVAGGNGLCSKHPLRIDLRHNDPSGFKGQQVLEQELEATDYKPLNGSGAGGGAAGGGGGLKIPSQTRMTAARIRRHLAQSSASAAGHHIKGAGSSAKLRRASSANRRASASAAAATTATAADVGVAGVSEKYQNADAAAFSGYNYVSDVERVVIPRLMRRASSAGAVRSRRPSSSSTASNAPGVSKTTKAQIRASQYGMGSDVDDSDREEYQPAAFTATGAGTGAGTLHGNFAAASTGLRRQRPHSASPIISTPKATASGSNNAFFGGGENRHLVGGGGIASAGEGFSHSDHYYDYDHALPQRDRSSSSSSSLLASSPAMAAIAAAAANGGGRGLAGGADGASSSSALVRRPHSANGAVERRVISGSKVQFLDSDSAKQSLKHSLGLGGEYISGGGGRRRSLVELEDGIDDDGNDDEEEEVNLSGLLEEAEAEEENERRRSRHGGTGGDITTSNSSSIAHHRRKSSVVGSGVGSGVGVGGYRKASKVKTKRRNSKYVDTTTDDDDSQQLYESDDAASGFHQGDDGDKNYHRPRSSSGGTGGNNILANMRSSLQRRMKSNGGGGGGGGNGNDRGSEAEAEGLLLDMRMETRRGSMRDSSSERKGQMLLPLQQQHQQQQHLTRRTADPLSKVPLRARDDNTSYALRKGVAELLSSPLIGHTHTSTPTRDNQDHRQVQFNKNAEQEGAEARNPPSHTSTSVHTSSIRGNSSLWGTEEEQERQKNIKTIHSDIMARAKKAYGADAGASLRQFEDPSGDNVNPPGLDRLRRAIDSSSKINNKGDRASSDYPTYGSPVRNKLRRPLSANEATTRTAAGAAASPASNGDAGGGGSVYTGGDTSDRPPLHAPRFLSDKRRPASASASSSSPSGNKLISPISPSTMRWDETVQGFITGKSAARDYAADDTDYDSSSPTKGAVGQVVHTQPQPQKIKGGSFGRSARDTGSGLYVGDSTIVPTTTTTTTTTAAAATGNNKLAPVVVASTTSTSMVPSRKPLKRSSSSSSSAKKSKAAAVADQDYDAQIHSVKQLQKLNPALLF